MPSSAWPRSVVAIVACGVVLASASDAQAGNFDPEPGADFDCDGIRDWIRYDANEVDGVETPGSLIVTYSRTGASHRISQASPGVPGAPEQNDGFGWAYTAYDRNRDGCDELVVGIPNEDVGSRRNAGMITIIPGSADGLDTRESTGYTQNSAGFPGGVEAWDRFGQSLAAGQTHRGTPFLLIGSPGESGPKFATSQAGAIHYVRPGSVTMIHADKPGVPAKRELGDYFGEVLVASDRYFVVGSPQENISGEGYSGMVHVFSHTLTDGRPSPVAAFHQNTAGISGVAEWDDRFGYSLSVLSYRRTSTSAVGALVAVGTATEDVGNTVDAGMAHLVYVSADGNARQLASFTQATAGVTGSPERGDMLGYDTVLANLDPARQVATPERAAWAVAVPDEELSNDRVGATHVLRPGWRPGDQDRWLTEDRFGLGPVHQAARLRASHGELHVFGGRCYAVPWSNLLSGASDPVVKLPDDCR